MTMTIAGGSAERHGPLWGARADDWAANEEQQVPTYRAALRHAGVRCDHRVLDVGCGSGVFLRLAADEGAAVHGIDASEALVALARRRVPEADVRVGEMEALPYEDETFDVVTGFNSFFFAADMVGALREARRVARPGAAVVIQVWGHPERCDLTTMKAALARFRPPAPTGAATPPPLWEPGVLKGLAAEAGLEPVVAFSLTWAYQYPDGDALARAMLAPGLVTELLRTTPEEHLRGAIAAALMRYRTPTGAYRLQNEWRFVIARR